MKLILASSNPHKVEEIKAIVPSELELDLKCLADIDFTTPIPETQKTIEGNALQKANFLHQRIGGNVFSEDTGLEIKALNGAPGVHTARYAGDEKDPQKNMDLVLDQLKDKSDRSARFKTIIVLILEQRKYLFEGIINGKIALGRTGQGGFGYDPIFIPNGYDQSFAELNSSVKNKISHRALATDKLIQFLKYYHIQNKA